MKILAFETSCDDTSIALFENERLISMHTASQIKIHNKTGGVVPEIASREHANVIFEVLDDVMREAKVTLEEIDYIAVTTHPGLIPSLLTGITVASTISQTLSIPIIPIDHIQAHIFANFLERNEKEISFPLVCLTVSGGHNEIYYMQDMWKREKLGQTQDDAAGEAFDKVAKMMGLEYPGGPVVSRLADEYAALLSSKGQVKEGTKGLSGSGSKAEEIHRGGDCVRKKPLFPRVFLEKSEFGFSFSGLKSAVKREVDARKSLPMIGGGDVTEGQRGLSLDDQREISYEFQAAVNEVLCYKLLSAAEQKGVQTIMLAGGVSANDDLNERIQAGAQQRGLTFIAPKKKVYCMDNAAMVGILAYYRVKHGQYETQIGCVGVGKW